MSRKRLAYSHVRVNLSKIAVTLDILAGDDMIWSLSWILHHFSSRGQRRRHNRGWGIRKNRLDFLCSLKWEFCEKQTSLSLSYQISWLVCPCSRGCPELFSEGRCPWLTEPEKATQTQRERENRVCTQDSADVQCSHLQFCRRSQFGSKEKRSWRCFWCRQTCG